MSNVILLWSEHFHIDIWSIVFYVIGSREHVVASNIGWCLSVQVISIHLSKVINLQLPLMFL